MVDPWRRIDPTTVTKVSYRTLVEKSFVLPDGKVHSYTTLQPEGGRSCAVIALTPDGQVIIARQFRPGPERIMDEIPGGGVEPGEDPQAAVLRELAEETGYVPDAVEFIGSSCRDGFSNALYYYYFATGCMLRQEGQQLDDNEYIEVALVSIPTLLEIAKTDQMSDPAAVLFAYDRLLTCIDVR